MRFEFAAFFAWVFFRANLFFDGGLCLTEFIGAASETKNVCAR